MAIDVKEALKIISDLELKTKFEILPIEDSINRICAQNIKATSSLPKFNNSAMDGYAILHEDCGEELEVKDTIFAGDNNNLLLENKTCVKINDRCKSSR